jgi:nucleoside-diphosphate-sugar epimerase
VLLVGAKGFVGAELSRELLRRGHEVVALELRATPGRLSDVAAEIEWHAGDAASLEALLAAIGRRPVDAVYYGPFYRDPAGERSVERELQVMAVGAWNAFNLARGLDLDRVLFPSSTAVHGYQVAGEAPVDESSAVRPYGLYGATKLLCERVAAEVNELVGRNVVTSVRLPSVYGPGADVGSRGVNVPAVSAARGQVGRVGYSADARLCIAHVLDCATALADILERSDAAHSVYELGGLDVSFGEIAASVARLVPQATTEFGADERVRFPFAVDWRRGRDEFGFDHRSLDAGMSSIVEFERARVPAQLGASR